MVAYFLDPLVFTPIDLHLNYYIFFLKSNCNILGTKFLKLKKKEREREREKQSKNSPVNMAIGLSPKGKRVVSRHVYELEVLLLSSQILITLLRCSTSLPNMSNLKVPNCVI